MSHLIYHWRYDNYRRDLDMGVGFHLNQNAQTLHAIERGESLWAFTRAPNGAYVLAAELICHHKTLNPEGFRYGPYRVWGELERSRYFAVEGQDDLSSLVRGFDLKTGTMGTPLGRAFQGKAAVRVISEKEHQLLKRWAQELPLEQRAQLLPEDLLERDSHDFLEAYQQSASSVHTLPISAERRAYLSTRMVTRRSSIVRELRELYDGRCQLTGWNPRELYGRDLCEAHHVHWLSRGGDDELHNLILVAPNQHRLLHATDAPFDYQRQCFIAGDQALPLVEPRHELLMG